MNSKGNAKPKRQTATAVALSLAIGGCTAGAAETMSIRCEADAVAGGIPALSLTYEGDDSGTLTIASSLGEMVLPATREEREGENEGAKYTVIGITASGPANLLISDKAAMEACIAGRTPGEQANDPDFVTMAADACRREVPLATARLPINARAEIAVMEAPGVYVYLTLTYADKSNVPGEHITIETLPPPSCVVTDPR